MKQNQLSSTNTLPRFYMVYNSLDTQGFHFQIWDRKYNTWCGAVDSERVAADIIESANQCDRRPEADYSHSSDLN